MNKELIKEQAEGTAKHIGILVKGSIETTIRESLEAQREEFKKTLEGILDEITICLSHKTTTCDCEISPLGVKQIILKELEKL